jgi:hypothetical protein
MTLSTLEFLRRFVQHILPRRFVRIRHVNNHVTCPPLIS